MPWPRLAGAAILVGGIGVIYRGTLAVPLLLDDHPAIASNATIRRLWPLGPVLSPPVQAGVGGRPLLNLSYALNYAWSGDAVAGYHLLNLLIHALATLALFGCVRRTLQQPALRGRFGAAATGLAFAAAAFWGWHPLQTESVTYLSQRAESLMGLFYLLTLYGFIRSADASTVGSARLWRAVSVLSCLAGVGTKEVIATAPLMVLLYDRTFVSGSFSAAWQRHRFFLLGLAATWIPLGLLAAGLRHRGVGFGLGVGAGTYALTECRVLVKYLLLSVWPSPLVFDYGDSAVTGPISGLWPFALIVGALLGLAMMALRRFPGAGFAACWFFLILAPTSSFVPIAGQPMAESRLYLPLAGLTVLAVTAAWVALGRRSWPLLAAVAGVLGVAAAHRNQDYSSGVRIWRDTVAKAPENARAHDNLGYELSQLPGQLPAAVAEYREALRLRPEFAEAHNNLGAALERSPGRESDALAEFETAVRLRPDFAQARANLQTMRSRVAAADYNRANDLKNIPGREPEAIAAYREALRLRPDWPEAHNNLGTTWYRLGRTAAAIEEYREALRLDPSFGPAQRNVAAALQSGAKAP